MRIKDVSLSAVSRRRALSERCSYSPPVTIHESERMTITVVPFYVSTSHGPKAACKISKKAKVERSSEQETTISLDDHAIRRLLDTLGESLAVAREDADGEYVVIRKSDGQVQASGSSTEQVVRAVLAVLSQQNIAEYIAGKEISLELPGVFKLAMRIHELRTALVSLRQYLDSEIGDERVYQEWCSEHSWVFGNAYVMCDDVRSISAGDKIDLLLPAVISGFRDIVELKRPDMKVVSYDSSHKNFYWSSDVSKAIGQCQRYLDVLAEEASQGLRDHRDIIAYHPRATIVIGRSILHSKDELKAVHGLNARLNGITVMTYDHLLAQGERLLSVMEAESVRDQVALTVSK